MNPQSKMLRMRSALSPLLAYAWRLILVLTVARVLLVVWLAPRVMAADMLAPVFLQGLRFDLVLLGITLAPLVLLFPLLASSPLLLPAWRALLRVYLSVVLLAVTFMELATPSFINQFDSRPNILFVDYLDHPREVMATLWAAYHWQLALALIILMFTGWLLARPLQTVIRTAQPAGWGRALLVTPLLLVVCFGLIRSTTDHRPVNPSTVALSTDPLANDLALNSAYTVLYALYETRHESDGGFRYADLPDRQVFDEVRAAMQVEEQDFTSRELPTLHRQTGNGLSRGPLNLVIIIEESLGAEFVGRLGGLDLTPNLDALGDDGIWFENMYATGTRSVRGLEAIVSGYTPTPARSVVKLPKSQKGFFTLAQLLGEKGYATSFVYGGEAQFDNMRRFFMNNGFQQVIDEKDYVDPIFTGSWGVSDEDLFLRAHEEFSQRGNKPFFSVVFSSSNHSPFQFPDDRIELYDANKETVNNAVKYADHALGRFFELARASDYWENTIFLVVADHNSRVYGSEIVPIDRFHIPALILGGPVEPAIFTPVASQIDLGPTLVSMLGIDTEHPMIGHDLTNPQYGRLPGRAIMQFNGTQAYMENDRVVLLQKDLPPRQMRFKDGRLVDDDESDPDMQRKAIAHSIWSSLAYERSLYRLETPKTRLVSANADDQQASSID